MSLDNRPSGTTRITRRSLVASLGAGGVVTLAGCSGDDDNGGDGGDGGSGSGGDGGAGTDGGSGGGEESTIVWAGSDAGVDGLLARVARDQNFDDDYNFNLEVENFSAASLEAAIGQGQVDTGNMSTTVAARINNNSADRRLVCMRPLYRIHEQIVLHPDIAGDVSDDIEAGLGDLRDYTLGSLGEGSSVYNIFDLIVTQYGYDIDDYDLRFLDPAAMVQQMIQGNLDGILSFDPPSSRLLARDEGYEILFEYNELWEDANGHELPIGEVTTYWDNIEGNEQAWKELDQMWNDVGAYIIEDTDQVLADYQDHLGLQNEQEIEVAQERMSELFYDSWNEDAREGSRALIEQSIEAGVIEDADLDELFIHPDDL